MGDYAPLSAACVRALNDKLYERRKAAALEIEKMTREFVQLGNKMQLLKLTRVLGDDFIGSSSANVRKGGLIGLAAMAVGLGKEAGAYINELIRPILTCFADSDSRVRYYACESLYNIVKVARSDVLPLFNKIFSSMGLVVADPDQSVKAGAELIDRLLKDIVTESPAFEIREFLPSLKERMYSKDPFARQFNLGWIQAMDKVPSSDIIVYLPDFIDPLFEILSDSNPDIYTKCENTLGQFLARVKEHPEQVAYTEMINIIIIHSQSPQVRLQIMAVHWILEFVNLSKRAMLPFVGGILLAILPNLSFDDEQRRTMTQMEYRTIRDLCDKVNVDLMRLVQKTASTKLRKKSKGEINDASDIPSQTSDLDISSLLDVLTKQLQRGKVDTKLACLRWIYHLFKVFPRDMGSHVDTVFPVLLKTLSDSSEEVVILTLQVLSEICEPKPNNEAEEIVDENRKNGQYFKPFILSLLKLFRADKNLLETKGSFIIRQLCVTLNAEDIYRSISELLVLEDDLKFAHLMVETLSTILLTSVELFDLRSKLKKLNSKESCQLFCCLYRTWCHSAIATIALCLQSGCYKHAGDLISIISENELTVEVLMELDRLVQLLESPLFTYVRMELLDVKRNGELIHTLYKILMLLPQSHAFKTLKERLSAIPSYPVASETSESEVVVKIRNLDEIDFESLLKHYKTVQHQHRNLSSSERKKEIATSGVCILNLEEED